VVVGARFADHAFTPSPKPQVGTGVTVPWNTYALWNLSLLGLVGFPLIGDAAFDPSQAGVEEVSGIALIQALKPATRAVLLDVGLEPDWNMEGWDDERRRKHAAKLASKVSRAAAQMEKLRLLGIDDPKVIHLP
jgi:hypothetical protein